MTPYSGPKLSDFYTLSQTKLLENHTLLHNGTYLYIPYMAVSPPPGGLDADSYVHNLDILSLVKNIWELKHERLYFYFVF